METSPARRSACARGDTSRHKGERTNLESRSRPRLADKHRRGGESQKHYEKPAGKGQVPEAYASMADTSVQRRGQGDQCQYIVLLSPDDPARHRWLHRKVRIASGLHHERSAFRGGLADRGLPRDKHGDRLVRRGCRVASPARVPPAMAGASAWPCLPGRYKPAQPNGCSALCRGIGRRSVPPAEGRVLLPVARRS